MKKASKVFVLTTLILSLIFVAACGQGNLNSNQTVSDENVTGSDSKKETGVVNLYTSRHYETDQELYDLFAEETGIQVNIVEGKGDELIERLNIEGENTEADLFITSDAGNLHIAKDLGLLQPVTSDILTVNIPEKLRDIDNEWFGLTKRARVIVYVKDRVNTSDLSTYEALMEPEWEDRVLARSSGNMYNISLLASFIQIMGEEGAKEWAAGMVANMEREPKGNDRDQAKDAVAGLGDVAIMNTYYVGRMLNSEDPEEVKVAESVGIFFPNQETTGTHVNISGVSLIKHAQNKDNAIKLMEFLSGEKAQGKFAEANYEYPVNPNVEPSELLKSWGEFKEQDIDLTVLGQNQQQAIKIFDQVGWK